MPEVISNTSPLFYLHQIGRLNLLQKLYSSIKTPNAVYQELQAGKDQGISIPNIQDLEWINIAAPKTEYVPNIIDLGAGEAEVIALGIENPNSLLILDDALGRRIARLYNLKFTGTLGVLVRAKESGYIDLVAPLIQSLQQQGMWLTQDIISSILKLAKEAP